MSQIHVAGGSRFQCVSALLLALSVRTSLLVNESFCAGHDAHLNVISLLLFQFFAFVFEYVRRTVESNSRPSFGRATARDQECGWVRDEV